MAKFYVDDRSPIVAELIRQDFDFEESEALRLIDMDETASNTDGTFALGTGAACIAATAGTLALSGLTLPILLPAIGIGLSSVSYWNSKVAARSREMETQFLSDHPEVLAKVQGKLRAGESRETIAAAFEQCLRAYRWGDVKQMERVLGNSPATATAETTAQSCIQNSDASNATRTESAALAQTIADKTYICVQSVGTIPDHTQTGTPRKLAEKLALAQGFAWSDLKTQDEKEQKNGLPWFNFLFENKSCYPSDFWCRLYEQPIAPGVAAAAPSMSVVNGIETIAPRDIATDLGNNPQSALIFGTPGAGKGMNISNAIRTLRAKLPNVTVMMVDPKGDKKEIGYWASQVDIFESRALLKSSPRSSAEWMLRCVEKFSQIDGPKLLVWDELFASITVLKGQNVPKGEDAFPCLTDFQQFISLNLSLGPSSGIWVWGMSQSANLSDLGLTSGGLSTTRIIALISPDNVGAVEGYLATKAITSPKGGLETLDRLMESSPVGRACYDGKTKRWYPMARLENHSGFDRDSADWNNLNKVAPDTRSPSPTIEPQSSESTRSRRGRITIPTRSSSSDARQKLEQAWEVAPTETTVLDAAMELINEESNAAKREALTIAYQWARARQDKGDSVDRQTFLERARKDRNSEYLRENRDEVWEELQGLLT